MADDYKEFLKKDFLEEVKKYKRLHYILEEKSNSQNFSNDLRIVYQDDNF